MRHRPVLAGLAVAASMAACSPTNPDSIGASGDASTGVPQEAGPLFVEDDSAVPDLDAAPPPLAGLRIANWSPDAPAIDFCLAPHGTTQFLGPLLLGGLQAEADASAGTSGDAGSPGVAYPQTSSYFYVPPGRYDARVVAAGAPDCSVGVLTPDDTNVVSSDAETLATIALLGDVKPPNGGQLITLSSFRDEFVTTFEDSGLPFTPMRFINASPSTPLMSFGTGSLSQADFIQYFVGVPFGQAGNAQEADATEVIPPQSPLMVDPNGYIPLGSVLPGQQSVHAFKGTTDLAVSNGAGIPPGIVVTMVAIGDVNVQILQCFDTAGTGGLLSTCSIISQ